MATLDQMEMFAPDPGQADISLELLIAEYEVTDTGAVIRRGYEPLDANWAYEHAT